MGESIESGKAAAQRRPMPEVTLLSREEEAYISGVIKRFQREGGFFNEKHRSLTEFALRWMLEIRLYSEDVDVAVKALTAASFVVCCAPDGTTIEQDKVATQWDVLLFLANDMPVSDLRRFYSGLDDVFHGAEGTDLHRIFRYWLPQLESQWDHDLLLRFEASWKELTASFIRRSEEGNVAGLRRYDDARIINIAVDNWIDAWCAILGLRIASEVEFDLHDLRRWCDRLVYFCNDLGSLPRDLEKCARGEAFDASIVTVFQQETGLDLESSIDWAIKYHNDLAVDFDHLYHGMRRKYQDDVSVLRYLSFLEQIIPGHFEVIYRHSYRYGSHDLLRRLELPRCCLGRMSKL